MISDAYLPTSWLVGLQVGGVHAVVLAIGWALGRLSGARTAGVLAWVLAAAGVVATDRICAAEPAGFRMLALAGSVLYAMKGLVYVESRARGMPQLPIRRWLMFSVLWVGMRPGLFVTRRSAHRDAARLARHGLVMFGLGIGLTLVARLVWTLTESRLVASVIVMVGLSLTLHFGIFSLLTSFWRLRGFDCKPLFRAPLFAQTLNEFWSRRWNLAFSEMTAVVVFRQLAGSLGRPAAMVGAFAFSGALHEIAISLPVGAGWGLPSIYFVIHGIASVVEQRLAPRLRGVGARLWTITLVVAPLPLVFHVPFLAEVVWPIAGIGAVD